MVDQPDYTVMNGPELLSACGHDAMKWAEAFQQIVVDKGLEIDQGLMVGWFANPIMNMHDHLTGAGPVVLPDASAVVLGTVGLAEPEKNDV